MIKQSKQYKLIIFDLDGTLLDTLPDLANGANYALAQCGLPARETDDVRRFIGNGIYKTLERCVYAPGGEDAPIDGYTVADKDLVDRLYGVFRGYYPNHFADATIIFPGLENIPARLKASGLRLAVVTNKSDNTAKLLIEKFFPGCFDMVIGDRGREYPRKPSPDSVLDVMDKLEIKPGETVYIGDSGIDIETAKNAKIDCISSTWGYRSAEELKKAGAKKIILHPEELLEILK